jgi:hypothetical protein
LLDVTYRLHVYSSSRWYFVDSIVNIIANAALKKRLMHKFTKKPGRLEKICQAIMGFYWLWESLVF